MKAVLSLVLFGPKLLWNFAVAANYFVPGFGVWAAIPPALLARRRRASRPRLAAASAAAALVLAASLPTFWSLQSWMNWHMGGGGVLPGMSREQAGAAVRRRARIVDDSSRRWEIEPKSFLRFSEVSFPISELYYLDLEIAPDGTVLSVKPWRD